MRALALLLLCACKGSPDSVTVFGSRGTAAYDNAAGNPAFDEVAYGYGAALTWNLPTTHSLLQDEQQRETLELLRALERDAHDANLHSGAATITPAEKTTEEDWLTLRIKGLIGAAATLATAALAVFRKKLGIKLPSFKKKPKEPHP